MDIVKFKGIEIEYSMNIADVLSEIMQMDANVSGAIEDVEIFTGKRQFIINYKNHRAFKTFSEVFNAEFSFCLKNGANARLWNIPDQTVCGVLQLCDDVIKQR